MYQNIVSLLPSCFALQPFVDMYSSQFTDVFRNYNKKERIGCSEFRVIQFLAYNGQGEQGEL